MSARWKRTLLGLGMLTVTRIGWGDALTYHPLPPCRLIDTRFWNSGTSAQGPLPMGAGEIRAFEAIGEDLRPQGGSPSGCDVPSENVSDLRLRAEAIAVNLVAVDAAGPGDLRVFPGNASVAPLASVINYVGGQTIAVGTIIPLRTDATADAFKIQADVSGTHVVVDVVGYYSRATSTTFLTRLNGIPAHGATAPTLHYGAPSGTDFVTTVRADHQMRVPRGCSAGRIQVDETVPVPAGGGFRVYTLFAGTSGSTLLASCNTGSGVTGGFCQNTFSAAIPLLQERLVLEVSLNGVVPATQAMVTFEMVCE